MFVDWTLTAASPWPSSLRSLLSAGPESCGANPAAVNSISLAFSSTRRLNRDSVGKHQVMNRGDADSLRTEVSNSIYLQIYSELYITPYLKHFYFEILENISTQISVQIKPTFNEGIAYDNVLSSVLGQKIFSCKRREITQRLCSLTVHTRRL